MARYFYLCIFYHCPIKIDIMKSVKNIQNNNIIPRSSYTIDALYIMLALYYILFKVTTHKCPGIIYISTLARTKKKYSHHKILYRYTVVKNNVNLITINVQKHTEQGIKTKKMACETPYNDIPFEAVPYEETYNNQRLQKPSVPTVSTF